MSATAKARQQRDPLPEGPEVEDLTPEEMDELDRRMDEAERDENLVPLEAVLAALRGA